LTVARFFSFQGNFVNRALKFCKENFGGKLEEVKLSAEKGDDAVIALVNRYLKTYVDQVSYFQGVE
jgi:methionyl-tRNA synthetase